jgi:hypothetical protein
MIMVLTTDEPDPVDPERRQGFTATELDDLIWDVAVGRPTPVVLDTASKRAAYFAVHKRIREAVAKSRRSAAPG